MTTGQIIGLVLGLAAIVDLVVGHFVVLPRIEEERTRLAVRSALFLGAGTMFALGVAFWVGTLEA